MRKLKRFILIIFVIAITGISNISCSPTISTDVYKMNDQEAIVWVRANDIEVPKDLDNEGLGETILIVIKAHKEGYRASNGISYDVTRDFMRAIENKLDTLYPPSTSSPQK